ncbi:hypothetical protein PR048_004914 [Dryococelus australis]|uniref:Uncharacterized protein n=1 Tax=Dryococelus australis TaxID=614101 RepID=A0ABQ9I6S3_9NEOP|nr:hypothetical protein PR048_004914 [Dryococelus australis]
MATYNHISDSRSAGLPRRLSEDIFTIQAFLCQFPAENNATHIRRHGPERLGHRSRPRPPARLRSSEPPSWGGGRTKTAHSCPVGTSSEFLPHELLAVMFVGMIFFLHSPGLPNQLLPMPMFDKYYSGFTNAPLFERPAAVFERLACSPPTHGEPGSIPGRITPAFLHVGIVPDHASGWRVFSGIFRFSRPFIPVLLHTHLNHPHRASGAEGSVIAVVNGSSQSTGRRKLLRTAGFLIKPLEIPDVRGFRERTQAGIVKLVADVLGMAIDARLRSDDRQWLETPRQKCSEEIWADLNIQVLRADERSVWCSAGIEELGKREIPEQNPPTSDRAAQQHDSS